MEEINLYPLDALLIFYGAASLFVGIVAGLCCRAAKLRIDETTKTMNIISSTTNWKRAKT